MHSAMNVYQSKRCLATRPPLQTSKDGRQPVLCPAGRPDQPQSTRSLRDVLQQYHGLVAPTRWQPAAPAKPTPDHIAASNSSKNQSKGKLDKAAHSSKSALKAQPPGKLTSDKQNGRSRTSTRQQASSKSNSSNSKGNSSDSSKASSNSKAADSIKAAKPSSTGGITSSSRNSRSNSSVVVRKPQQPLITNSKGYGSLPSTGKGFMPLHSTSSSNSNSSTNSSGKQLLKLCRYAVEATAVQKALDACGWSHLVKQVEGIGQADVMVAVKNTPGGKHQNLTQGERSAKNAGIPFLVVGRKMSKDNLQKALRPYLEPKRQHSPEGLAEQARLAHEETERKAFADAWFSAASTARWGKGASVGVLQQQAGRRQQQLLSQQAVAAAVAAKSSNSSIQVTKSSSSSGPSTGSSGRRQRQKLLK